MCRAHYNRWQKHGDPLGGSAEYRSTWTKAVSLNDYILQRVDTSRGPDACWPWMGGLNQDGYGMSLEGLASRHLYEHLVGPIPDGMTLDHVCHTRDATCPGGLACPHRICVNVFRHLEPVTFEENIRRAVERRERGAVTRASRRPA